MTTTVTGLPSAWRLAGLLVAVGAVLPRSVGAQGPPFVHPSVSLTELHDSNLFSTSSSRHADFITRLTPSVDAEYRKPRLRLFGHYSFDAERYATHTELTAMQTRQQTFFGFGYTPSPRLTMTIQADAARTRTPGELFVETGMTLPRARASRVGGRSTLTRRLDPRTDGTLEYMFRQDRIQGGMSVRAHLGTASAERHLSSRASARLDYLIEQYEFEQPSAALTSSAISHALRAGWTRAITPRTSVSLAGGPRLTNGQVSPDVSASVRRESDGGEMSLSFQRTQTAMIGLARPVLVDNVIGSVVWGAPRRPRLRTTSAFFRSSIENLHTDVYSLGVGFEYPFGRTLSIDVAFDSNTQSGRLHPALVDGRIRRHTTVIRLVATPPANRPR